MINTASAFGDLHSFKVEVDGTDMTEACHSVMIFQDIFSPIWSAHIEILDTVNAISTNDIKAESKVKINLESKHGHDTDAKYNMEMVIIEIGERIQQSQNTVSYTIKCAPKDLVKNQQEKISKSFKEKKVDEIVKEIAKDKLSGNVKDKPPEPEQLKPHVPFKKTEGKRVPSKTETELTWIAPNISPFTAIAHMLACASYQGKSDFVFFTKSLKDKTYSFESLSNMMKRKPHVKFVQRPNAIRKDGDYTNNKNLEFSHFAIDHFDLIGNISSGKTGNKVFTFDLNNKKWDSNPKGDKSDSVLKFMPKHQGMTDGANIFDNGKDWWQSRREELFKANQNLIKIQTPGHVKSFDWLGEICELDLPSNNSMKDPTALDDKYKGTYMIVAVGHIITKQSYFINIELANGWDKDDK